MIFAIFDKHSDMGFLSNSDILNTLEIQTAQKWANCPRLWCTGLAHTKHYKDEPHNGTDTAKNSDVNWAIFADY